MTDAWAQPEYWTDLPISQPGEPVWAVATLFPMQGDWTEKEYLALKTNHFVEFSGGFLRFLPMPDMNHQLILSKVALELASFAMPKGLGSVLIGPLPVHLRPGKYREPDIMFLSAGRNRLKRGYAEGADLVMEVVMGNEAARHHDYETKRIEYAQASIAEYWLIDHKDKLITVLSLAQDTYLVHGIFEADDTATSVLLDGFAIEVNDVFAAAEED
jgi:Uma2 family endonuclease